MTVYRDVRDRDLDRCRWCGRGDTIEVHHIVFRSQGGGDTPSNLVCLCNEHHRAAHGVDRIPAWKLQMLVMFDQWGWPRLDHRMRVRDSTGEVFRVCLSCDYRSEMDVCEMWEHPVEIDYSCNAWKVRGSGPAI